MSQSESFGNTASGGALLPAIENRRKKEVGQSLSRGSRGVQSAPSAALQTAALGRYEALEAASFGRFRTDLVA